MGLIVESNPRPLSDTWCSKRVKILPGRPLAAHRHRFGSWMKDHGHLKLRELVIEVHNIERVLRHFGEPRTPQTRTRSRPSLLQKSGAAA